MKTLRTPDSRFQDLPDFDYEPHYTEVPDGEGGRLRIHYVDAGPRDGSPVILFHGEPTWSYLYRKMIPVFVAGGHRVLVPDLVGFGRSDKPTEKFDYTFVRHFEWMQAWLRAVDVSNVTFFGQDWGSLIGIALCMREQERIARIAIGNGALPDLRHPERMVEAMAASPDPTAFTRWQEYAAARTEFDIGALLTGELDEAFPAGMEMQLSDAERAAYGAPFPDASYQAGALVFPSLVPSGPEHADTIEEMIRAWEVLDGWTKPFLTTYGKADPMLGWFDVAFQNHVPGAAGQPHTSFADGRHFIQEQYGVEIAELMNRWIAES